MEQMAWPSVVSAKWTQTQYNTKQNTLLTLAAMALCLNFISISNHWAHLSCRILPSVTLFISLSFSSLYVPHRASISLILWRLTYWCVSISICCILGRLRWQSRQPCLQTKLQCCRGIRRLGGRKVSALLWPHPWNRWRGTGAVPVLVHASWHQSSSRWAISRHEVEGMGMRELMVCYRGQVEKS